MHDNLELLARVLAEVTSIIVALAVLVSKLSELEAQIRVNREHIRLHSGLLSDLGHDMKDLVCDRSDGREASERSPHS